MPELLRVEGLAAGYGEARILDDVEFTMAQGDSLALLGRNGVGKTTLIIALMGIARRFAGTIHWCGRPIERMRTYRRAQAGIGWVPQERHVFPSLTVEEHLTAVARPGPWDLRRTYALLPRLHERRGNLGNQLSGGEQQMLAIARALMLNPALLLLDEPMEGLAPIIVQELAQLLRGLVQSGDLAVIIVEQHARLALQMTRQALVLERGRIVHRGSSAELLADAAQLARLVAVA